MLRLNADNHSLMRRMHAPSKETYGVVIVPHGEWDNWLSCQYPELARSMLTLPPAEQLDTEPSPAPPRLSKKSASTADLFGATDA